MKGYMSVKDYADKNCISVQAVYKKIKNKQLDVKKIGSFTLVKDPD